jgi:hypothetical protein
LNPSEGVIERVSLYQTPFSRPRTDDGSSAGSVVGTVVEVGVGSPVDGVSTVVAGGVVVGAVADGDVFSEGVVEPPANGAEQPATRRTRASEITARARRDILPAGRAPVG